MIRPYRVTDKEHLLKIFNLNTPKCFDKKEICDFEEYLTQNPETYLTVERDNNIVGGTGYYINKMINKVKLLGFFLTQNMCEKVWGDNL
tara:strand:- start:155 stop:421 length:267 start_codon:yes stop_codon:yes gene_type:complete